MDAQDIPRNGNEAMPASALLDAAAALLAKRRPDIPADFLANAVRPCGAGGSRALRRGRRLPAFAEQSWAFLAERTAGAPKIRFEPAASPWPAFAVLEIVNDDMPFLVDFVVGELNRRGLDIRLFVHPVFVVERDPAGRLAGFIARAPRAGGSRESFIHLHIEGADDSGAARRNRSGA